MVVVTISNTAANST